MVALLLSTQNRTVAVDAIWPTKPKIFIWPFTEEVCWLQVQDDEKKKKKSSYLNVYQQVILKQRFTVYSLTALFCNLADERLQTFLRSSSHYVVWVGLGFCPHGSLEGSGPWRWLSGWSDGHASFSSPQKCLLLKDGWGSKILHILFPLYLTLTWLTLTLFQFYVPILVIRMWKKWKYQLLSCVQLFATPWIIARQAPLSRMVPINKKERKVLCSQTKLSFIAPTLAYPHWRNVSALKLALGVLIFWNSQEQQSWWNTLSFVKFAFWNGRYLSIIFFYFPWFMVKIIFSPPSLFCILARWTTGAGNGRQEGWDLAFEICGSKISSLQRPKIFLILYFLRKEIRYKAKEMKVKKFQVKPFLKILSQR